jgi:hypothetical protein
MTKSEMLFESFCEENAIRFDKVQVGRERTPDYILRFGDRSLVIEVKQFDAGPAERRTLQKSAEELDESDAFYDGIPGSRVRSKIGSVWLQWCWLISSGWARAVQIHYR